MSREELKSAIKKNKISSVVCSRAASACRSNTFSHMTEEISEGLLLIQRLLMSVCGSTKC